MDKAGLAHDLGKGEGELRPVLKACVAPSPCAGAAQAVLVNAGETGLTSKAVTCLE